VLLLVVEPQVQDLRGGRQVRSLAERMKPASASSTCARQAITSRR